MKQIHHYKQLSLLALLGLIGCGGPEKTSEVSSEPSPAVAEIESRFTTSPPTDAIAVGELLASTETEGTVSVVGQIGGTVSPFGEGYAVFFLADESLVFCTEMESDNCPTPWDACCEDPDKVKDNRLLVQFTGDSGEVLPISLNGIKNLEELRRVIVTGTLISAEGGGVILDAKTISTPAQNEKI